MSPSPPSGASGTSGASGAPSTSGAPATSGASAASATSGERTSSARAPSALTPPTRTSSARTSTTRASSARTPPTRASSARRRRLPRGWVPNQHGAWAMLVAPVVVGAALAGPDGWHALLLAAWLAGYCAYFAAGQWLRSHRKARYRPPVLGHGAAALLLGVLLLAARPGLLLWAPVFAVPLAVSLVCSARRADRSYLNDVVTVLAACVMTPVAAGLADAATLTGGAWPPGATSGRAWAAAGLLAGYFLGTVPYVKSMIRERGRVGTYRASVSLHAALLVAAVALAVTGAVRTAGGAALVVVAVGLLARAAVLPRRGPVRVAVVGAGEVAATVAVVAATLLAV